MKELTSMGYPKYTGEKREKHLAQQLAYRDKCKKENTGYSVYYIPEEHYVGMSNNPKYRIAKHKHLGKITEGWEILFSFENPILAHLMETKLHLMGYNGYRP